MYYITVGKLNHWKVRLYAGKVNDSAKVLSTVWLVHCPHLSSFSGMWSAHARPVNLIWNGIRTLFVRLPEVGGLGPIQTEFDGSWRRQDYSVEVHRQRHGTLLVIDHELMNCDDDESHHGIDRYRWRRLPAAGSAAAIFPSTTKPVLPMIDTEIQPTSNE